MHSELYELVLILPHCYMLYLYFQGNNQIQTNELDLLSIHSFITSQIPPNYFALVKENSEMKVKAGLLQSEHLFL